MKKLTLITAILMTANLLFAQINKIDTSFFSETLQETKMVDIYFPPGYDENPELYYPVIYYLHAWLADQNLMGSEMLAITQSMINNGSISPVIMVCADNSPDPFGGSMYANSILWGNYEDYMITDLIHWIENSFRAMPSKNYRALLGHSMGGYGAFRYGTLHKDKFRVLAATASAIINLTDDYLEYSRQKIMAQNPGPPYTYNYYTTEFSTKGLFLFCGAFSPNLNSPQTYINPQIVEFSMDSNGYWIDTIVDKMRNNSIDHLIHQLSPEDSVGILFGCGSADESIYPCHIAFKDTLDVMGLPYEFYDHSGGHIMPSGFKQRALFFIDSLLMPPIITPTTCLPEGITFTAQEQIDNFQTNYPACTEIEGNVTINGYDITNLNGLNVVTSIGMDFNIIGNDALVSLTGLENLSSVGNFLKIQGNDALTSLSGLNNLISCFALFIDFNDALTSLTGLENLTTTGSYFSITNNNSLANLTGLDNLNSVWGMLYIAQNNALVDLTGLESLNNSQATIAIDGNNALTSLTGLNNLTTTFGLSIGYNPLLSNLNGLGNLTSVGSGGLTINFSELISLTGLEGLNEVEGSLIIGQDIEGEGGNPSLISLTGLDNIDAGSITGLIITKNFLLSNCDVQSICDYLAEPGGNVEIWGNATGCNSPEEVQEACLTSIKDNSEDIEFTISPNPVSGFAEISLNSPANRHIEISLYNTAGICVKSWQYPQCQTGKNIFILDLKEIPSGIYFCQVQIGNEMITKKIIKL